MTSHVLTDEDLNATIAARRRQLSEQLARLGVVEGLSAEQRDTLTDAVMRFVAGYELSQLFPRSTRMFRAEKRVGRQQRKMFMTKIDKALSAIDDALKYAAKVGGASQPNEILARNLKGFAVDALEQAKTSLGLIHGWAAFTSPSDGQGFEDPKGEARIALMGFFVNQCGHTKSEASVRTGKIGNALLGWNVDLADQSESANPNRARAVLKSVQRAGKPRRVKRPS